MFGLDSEFGKLSTERQDEVKMLAMEIQTMIASHSMLMPLFESERAKRLMTHLILHTICVLNANGYDADNY